jgi:MtN3 and saliva related transmembrane protein
VSDLIANVVGTAAALCSITSFAPQMAKIWKERDASAVSLKTYSLTVTCFVLWTVYGVLTGAWPIVVANACALVMAAIVLGLKWRFSRDEAARDRP